MYTKKELTDAIEEIGGSKHTIQNCERLAAVYTVMDHLYPRADYPEEKPVNGYSGAQDPVSVPETSGTVKKFGDSEFLTEIVGKDEKKIWLLMDEVMDTISVLNPRIYDSVIRRIKN